MKHTELDYEYIKLEEIGYWELVAAINAHGGEYIFIDSDSEDNEDWSERDDFPIVQAYINYTDYAPTYCIITRVFVDDKENLIFWGFKDSCCDSPSDERQIEKIVPEWFGTIIDYIPETETVKDVSSTIFDHQSILIFNREDVENVGYNPDITPKQYKELVKAMKKACEWNKDIYWNALKQACENVGITPLNTKDDEEN